MFLAYFSADAWRCMKLFFAGGFEDCHDGCGQHVGADNTLSDWRSHTSWTPALRHRLHVILTAFGEASFSGSRFTGFQCFPQKEHTHKIIGTRV